MKNFRYLVMVVAIFNLSVLGAASAGPSTTTTSTFSQGSTGPSTMAIHTGNE